MTPGDVVTWVQQQERVALASRLWATEALTIVVVDADRVALLAQVLPGVAKGVEGGAVVVTHWVEKDGAPRAVRWHIASATDEFVATFGPHEGGFPHQQAQELTT